MNKAKWLGLIAWSEIIGGAVGFLVLPLIYFQQRRLPLPDELSVGPLWYIAGAIAFSVSVTAGILLRRGTALGRKMSLVLQAAQIPQFSTPLFVYQFVTGIEILAFASPYEIRFSPGVRAAFNAMPPKVAAPWSIAVNLFSVFALLVIIRKSRDPVVAPDVNAGVSPPAP